MKRTIAEIFRPDRAALAPLAGVTDSVFRRICVECGAIPVMTEMVSAEGYIRSLPGDKTARLLRYKESERPIGFQLFGSRIESMCGAADKALELGPDFIDINAGCPVKKVVSKGGGSALMRDPAHLENLVRAVTSVSTVPVTVKIRSGWDHGSINAVEVAKRCVDAGAGGIIVHPRPRSQGFSGKADWDVIRDVVEAVPVPVIGSGDIIEAADVVRMIESTGAHSVMIGRAAMGDPWIFSRVRALFNGDIGWIEPDHAVRLDTALRHLDILSEEVSERFAVLNMRKFFGWYSRGQRGGAVFRREVFTAETREEVAAIVRKRQQELRDQEHIHSIEG